MSRGWRKRTEGVGLDAGAGGSRSVEEIHKNIN